MTKGMGNITNVFAMGKGNTEGTTVSTTPDTAGNYTGNFLEKAMYKTPLNPLLCRGNLSEDFADFNVTQAATTEQPLGASLAALANTTGINSYEIHKADNATLTNSVTGINKSNSGTQTYSSVNRKYPDSTTISDHLSNLETTRGNVLKTYNYDTNVGQRLVTDITTLGEVLDATETHILVASISGISAGDIIVVNNEEMLVEISHSSHLHVVRGYNHTTATTHSNGDKVLLKDNVSNLWVLVYSDDPNAHHFAKVTEILEHDIWGDAIEFSPSLGIDIAKDTKFAIFDSNQSFSEIDADNQTLVACGYGLQSDASNNRHYLNTHVSRPFFYFLNGEDKLEPATRYVLRSSFWDGSSHTYTYSTFVTDQEYGTDIIDYGPYTMEATLVDMMYKADSPAAMNFLEYSDNSLNLEENGGSADTITVASDTSFDNLYTDLDGTEGTNWGLTGILRDSRFSIISSGTSGNNDVYCVDSATDSTSTTLTLDVGDLTADDDVGTTAALRLRFLAHSVDLDHNKMYCAFDSSNHLKNSFRMAHRPNDNGNYYAHKIGQTRYMHYTDSPLTNNISPNAMEMIDYESVTASGGYVDIVFADTQKILAKKMKEGDPLYIHEIIFNEEQGLNRVSEIGTFNYFIGDTTLTVDNLTENEDIRFLLMSPIPDSETDTSGDFDPLYDGFTVDVSGTLYHIIPDRITNPSGGSQTITPRLWRKATDTEYNTTTLAAGSVPSFSAKGYRRKYSFIADNIMTDIPIDSHILDYSLDYDGDSAAPTNRGLTTFDNLFSEGLDAQGTTINVGSNVMEKESHSRINNINLVLRGGSSTGHRLHVEYGDKYNKFIKLKTHLKDERFLESYNKTDFLPYSYGLSNVSLYGYPINTGSVPVSGSEKRYDLSENGLTTNNHVRGTLSYLDYFKGTYDIERKVFSGVIESIEQVVEDGMFKLKVRGRNDVGKLLGPIVNKDFKFTEDIVYSTVGPIARTAFYGNINHGTDRGVYEVGATEIIIDVDGDSLTNGAKGDLLFTHLGVFIGRIYNIVGSDGSATLSGSNEPYTITLEEGLPTRIKDVEPIYISAQLSLTDIVPDNISDTSTDASLTSQFIRGNTISFAKALSSNPFSTTRVNSLLGASDKGIIFNSGNSLTLTDGAPVGEGNTLVGTSSSSHPLAKGYSIHAIDGIDYDFPFYCHLADEITDKYTVDYVNLHTVNSLTDYDIISVTNTDNETLIEVAPICPAVLGRIDDNPLDSRDKTLVSMGTFPDATEVTGADLLPKGYNGIFQYSTWIEELNEGDFIFDSDGNLFGRIIDISVGASNGLLNNRIAFTLDRPLFKNVTSSTTIHKYYFAASPPQYIASDDIEFNSFNSTGITGGSESTDLDYRVSTIESSDATTRLFLDKLEAGMRIKIEGHAFRDNNGVFTISHVFTDDNNKFVVFHSRKQGSGYRVGDDTSNNLGYGGMTDDGEGDNVRITVLTDYFTQGLYFLNTQGLGQGGVVTLVNNSLSSPNAADNISKPIKWCGGLYHYITDNSVASGRGSNSDGYSYYNPNASAHSIFSDMIDRYGNTKWRYFGLQRGKYLSYINRRRKDGLIKDAYTTEKGRVNGYATAYRISDAKFGSNKIMKYPYGYHNNDFAWSVRMYDDNANAYVELFESENKIRTHPYFLEYLSPESRDFRPVMGSNFTDFTKHGTTVTSPEHSDYRLLQYPRFMPRLHDNFRGGDWQEDTESPLNSDLPSTLLQYRRWKTDSTNAYDYDIDYATGDAPTYLDPAAANDSIFTTSLASQWVKLSGWPDRNNNRTFKLSALSADVSNKLTLDISKPPFSQIGTQGSVSDSVAVGGSQDDSTGHEEISVLYPPWIGPKFDGITRAKDHWELPDPKTMRWFIFSPSDLYPDSMSRKNHIGYSGTVDSTTISRSFTDYNLLLKAPSSFSSSNVSHEYYEGSLEEEQEIDDQYESLPISSASIVPSKMKRFGLMRLVDCTYDWHFNLIDPERLPSDMSKLNTPNFEYTRYQPLKRLNLLISDYTNSDTRLTVSANPTSLVTAGDQVFTDKGFYLGKVKTRITGGTHAIELQQAARKPILQSSGTAGEYHGYVYVCGDGVTTISTQDYYDSFYRFQVKGRAGESSFTEVNFSQPLNMLQQMWNGCYHYPEGTSVVGSVAGTSFTDEIVTDSANWEFWQIPYGVTDGASGSVSLGHKGWSIADNDYRKNNLTSSDNQDVDANISSAKFFNHFNKNFLDVVSKSAYDSYSNLVGITAVSPFIALPPAFRTFYGTAYSNASTGKTINVMQEKKFITTKTETPAVTGVTKNGTLSADGGTSIVVNGNDADDHFSVGDILYDNTGAVCGLIKAIPDANTITLYENNLTTLSDTEDLKKVTFNPINTEYTHPSNILEWQQLGGNPYVGCQVISLGRYNVENSIGVNIHTGARSQVWDSWQKNMLEHFPYSKTSSTAIPTADSEAESNIPYGNGFGLITGSDYYSDVSGEYSFSVTKGNSFWGYGVWNADTEGYYGGHVGDGKGYVADGVFGVFHPILHVGTNKKLTLTNGDVDESRKGIFAFNSVNGNTKEGVLRLTSGPDDLEDNNAWLNFVDLTGMYLVGNIGTTVKGNSTRLNYAPFNGDVYDIPAWFNYKERSDNKINLRPDVFFMSVTTTSGSAVVNYGPSASGSPANAKLEAGDVLTIIGGNGVNYRTISSVDTSSNQKNFTMSATASASGTIDVAIYRASASAAGGYTSMADTMVDPNHIIYVKEHRRNITGKTVAHELLLDNVPYNLSGNVQFFDNYRVMRPAETCLWRNSPEEIDMYKLSAQTTKMPQEDKMYNYVPSLYRVHDDNSIAGIDNTAENIYLEGSVGSNEAVMSMYAAIDMDARHSQYISIGNVSAVNNSSIITSSSLFGNLQEGDTIKVGNQKCYVKHKTSVSSITIAGKYVGSTATVACNLLNNTYTVLRDYIHLFNPTGNRNTFKSGSSYNMLLTDGLSKQKISMTPDVDYYDDRALCRLSIGKIENDMLGIVSFGETFTLKSNKPAKSENYTSAKIGSTVIIGQEVEDVINNLLGSEDIQYDIQDDREYPYYIAPNYQGVDIFNAANFAAKYKEKEIRLDELGISLIKQTNVRDYRPIVLSYDNTDLKIISVTRNKSTFDLYNEIIVYGNGLKAIKRNRKSIEKFGKKTLEDVNMELISQDDVDSRAKTLLKAHSEGDDRFTVKMAKTGIELIRAGDIITLDFPAEGIDSGQYKIYEIRRELMGLVELEVGTYRKDLANRFAELSMLNKSNASSIRGSQFTSTTAPLDFFDTVKLKELRLVIKKISLADEDAFTIGFQTLEARKLDFGTTMAPLDTVTTIITDEDLI